MDVAKFDSSSRLILFAPHPDDEALACGVILQQAVRPGAAIRIVYVTDGDDNPWPYQALERLGHRTDHTCQQELLLLPGFHQIASRILPNGKAAAVNFDSRWLPVVTMFQENRNLTAITLLISAHQDYRTERHRPTYSTHFTRLSRLSFTDGGELALRCLGPTKPGLILEVSRP